VDRVLVVDKPGGITSHDVVVRLRRSTRVRRMGHAGTLDPSATGVLIVLVGSATRLMQFIVEDDKEYSGSIVLGKATDTHDAEGEITSERPLRRIDEDEIRNVLRQFIGVQSQIPPMTSAVKRGGRPLYELARKGIVVEREPRVIEVHRFELIGYRPPEVGFELSCSKGTYVRKLAHDVGERLGTGAHLGALRRTRVGRFTLGCAIELERLEALGPEIGDAGLSMFEALSGWPSVRLDDEEADRIAFGGAVVLPAERLAPRAGQHVRLTRDGKSLLAVGKLRSLGPHSLEARPVKVFETV